MTKSFDYYYEHIEWRARGKPDFSTLFVNSEVFRQLIRDLSQPFSKDAIDKVVSPESMGFILGSAVAQRLRAGFVPVRKGGRLPSLRKYLVSTGFVDYTRQKNTFDMHSKLLDKGDRVLLVDDWIETGGQARALLRLIERQGGTVVGISCLGYNRIPRTRRIHDNYRVNCILDYSMDEERDLTRPLST